MIDFPHVAARPSWDCRACGEPWPCTPAQRHLMGTLSPVRLAMYMWSNLEEAIFQGHFSSKDCPALFDRFILWTRSGRGIGTPARRFGEHQ